MRLIDEDELKDWSEIVPLTGDGGIDINDFEEKLKSIPTVDAVPVIRCKDCIWNREKEWVDCYMSGMHGRNVNNFCSRAERKDNGKTD